MLPSSDRVVSVLRNKYLPSRNRGILIPKEPTTIGGHLRKRRLELKVFQTKVARRLGVSTVTLSKWERDRLYPTWPYWPRIIAFLGHDPFDNRALGRPKGNESRDVASLSKLPADSLGHQIIRQRLVVNKSRKELADELGVSVKTLWGWEVNRRKPSNTLQQRVMEFVGRYRRAL